MAWPLVFCKYPACRNIKLKLFHFISFTDFPRQIVTFYQEISKSKGVVQGGGGGGGGVEDGGGGWTLI